MYYRNYTKRHSYRVDNYACIRLVKYAQLHLEVKVPVCFIKQTWTIH